LDLARRGGKDARDHAGIAGANALERDMLAVRAPGDGFGVVEIAWRPVLAAPDFLAATRPANDQIVVEDQRLQPAVGR